MSSGEWEGETPAPENVEIINYLNAVRPVPSDEQYLPAFCNVTQLLGQLLEFGDGELAQAVRRVARAVLEYCAGVDTKELAIVKETLEQLGELVKEEGEGGEGAEEGREEFSHH